MANDVKTLVKGIRNKLEGMLKARVRKRSNFTHKSFVKADVRDVIQQLKDLQELVAVLERERKRPSLEISDFVADLLANPTQTTAFSQAHPFESQVDCAVLALLRHFFRIEDKILIQNQWTYSEEAAQTILEVVANWSVQAAQGDTSKHYLNSSEEDAMEEMDEEELGMQDTQNVQAAQEEQDMQDTQNVQAAQEELEELVEQDEQVKPWQELDLDSEDEVDRTLDPESSFDIVAMTKTPAGTPEPLMIVEGESIPGFEANIAVASTPVKSANGSGPDPSTASAVDNDHPSTAPAADNDSSSTAPGSSTAPAADTDEGLSTAPAADNDHSIGLFELPTERSSISEFPFLTVDTLGRLVDKRPGKVPYKRPDFVVSRDNKPLLIIENKLRGKTPGVRQLCTYLRELGQDGTVGMCFSTDPRSGCLVVAMLRYEVRENHRLAVWIGAKLKPVPQCTWYRASDKLVRQTLLDIAMRAVDDV